MPHLMQTGRFTNHSLPPQDSQRFTVRFAMSITSVITSNTTNNMPKTIIVFILLPSLESGKKTQSIP